MLRENLRARRGKGSRKAPLSWSFLLHPHARAQQTLASVPNPAYLPAFIGSCKLENGFYVSKCWEKNKEEYFMEHENYTKLCSIVHEKFYCTVIGILLHVFCGSFLSNMEHRAVET